MEPEPASICGLLLGGGARLASGYPLNEKLHIALVGVGGRGGGNLKAIAELSQNIVALCDVDANTLAKAAQQFPKARTYKDFRQLVEQKNVDAVVVSTPDHTHAVATAAALEAEKHVYCEKPLTHTVEEVGVIRDLARRTRRATQMGTQIHASDNYRRVVELVRSGAIGAVREAHAWVAKNWGGGERPAGTPPVPAHLDYDLWLGPSAYRPYHPIYLPGNWRRWWDFGGGTLADMGCHFLDLPFWALDLGRPLSAQARGPQPHPETAPLWLSVEWEFPSRGGLPPVKLSWYDSGKRPEIEAFHEEIAAFANGVLFIGECGALLADYGRYKLLPETRFFGFEPPPPSIPTSIGHHNEWVVAAKYGGPTSCNFDYAGNLTETVLLGTVAYRLGEKVEWDAAARAVTNSTDAEKYLHKTYRDGWTLAARSRPAGPRSS